MASSLDRIPYLSSEVTLGVGVVDGPGVGNLILEVKDNLRVNMLNN